jgi:hypothetical protein
VNDTKTKTAAQLIDFTHELVRLGSINAATGGSYRSAIRKVLKVNGPGWEQIDIQQLDVDAQLDRFEAERSGAYGPQSLRTYRGRFKTVVAHFLDDEVGALQGPDPEVTDQSGGADEVRNYDFPLDTLRSALFTLPRNLSRRDAERISAFVSSLVIDD